MVFFAEDERGGTIGELTGLARDMQIMGWNACMSVLICNLHIPRGDCEPRVEGGGEPYVSFRKENLWARTL